jgi:hypothetical protein
MGTAISTLGSLTIFTLGMISLTAYSTFYPAAPKVDERFQVVTEALVTLQNRVEKIDQENQILFRMLRNDNGLTNDPRTVPVVPAQRPLGDVPLGDVPLGDAPVR